jgi:hypothetical protein
MAIMVPVGGTSWVCIGAQGIAGGCNAGGAAGCQPGGACGANATASDMLHHDYVNRTPPPRVIAYDGFLRISNPTAHALMNTMAGLELTLRSELAAAGGGQIGNQMVTRFMTGTGGTLLHGPNSAVSRMAAASARFPPVLGQIKTEIKARLATQGGAALPQYDLEVRNVPWIAFPISNAVPWQAPHERTMAAAIGGTKGLRVFAKALQVNQGPRNFSVTLRIEICDHFGVDESDLYSPGLFAFWKLQHDRPGPQRPFANLIVIEIGVSDTF